MFDLDHLQRAPVDSGGVCLSPAAKRRDPCTGYNHRNCFSGGVRGDLRPGCLYRNAPAKPGAPFVPPVERLYEHISLLEIIALVWIAVAACFLLAHVALHLLNARFLLKNGSSVTDQEIVSQFEQIKRDMRVTRKIRLLVCEKADSPLLLGLFRPCLLLPRPDFTPEQLAVIFRHELAHCKRHDLLMKWLFLLARSVHWFNPLVHIMAGKASLDLESACDDTVLHGKDSSYRKQYGTVLLDVMAEKKRSLPLSTHFAGNAKDVLRRFRNIVNTVPKRKGALLLCCVVVGTVALTSSLNPAAAQTLTPGALSLLKATDATPEELTAKKELLAQCLEGSVFENYKSFRDLPLSQADYQRCEQAEADYRNLLAGVSPGMQKLEYAVNPSFLAIDSRAEGPVTSGLFCCQADNQLKNGQMELIALDFSNLSHLEVTEIGTAFATGGKYLDERVSALQAEEKHVRAIADAFAIDLSQCDRAFSEVYPAVIQNRAYLLKSSIKKQLTRTGRYSFEKFPFRYIWAYIKKGNTGGVVLNYDDTGIYAHFFRLDAYETRSLRRGVEPLYPLTENRCIPGDSRILLQ